MWQLVNPGIQLATLPKRSSTISETHVGHGKAGWLEEDGFLPLASFSSPLQPITFQAKYRPAPGRTGELGHRSEAPGAKTKTKSRGVPDPPNLPLPSRSGSLLPPVAFFLSHSVPRPFSYISLPPASLVLLLPLPQFRAPTIPPPPPHPEGRLATRLRRIPRPDSRYVRACTHMFVSRPRSLAR